MIVPEDVSPVNPVKVPAPIKFAPLAVKANVPPGTSCTSPVSVSPKVKVCFVVVAKVPVALRYTPPAAPAETDAVGVPVATFKKPNLADAVLIDPIKTSSDAFIGEMALEFLCQYPAVPDEAPIKLAA